MNIDKRFFLKIRLRVVLYTSYIKHNLRSLHIVATTVKSTNLFHVWPWLKKWVFIEHFIIHIDISQGS